MANDLKAEYLDCFKMIECPLVLNMLLSVAGFFMTLRIIPAMKEMFIVAGLKGKDMGKKEKPEM